MEEVAMREQRVRTLDGPMPSLDAKSYAMLT